MPTTMASFGLVASGDKLYAIGSQGTFEYSPAFNNWTQKTSMPTQRARFGVSTFQGKIYCIGGAVAGIGYTNVNEAYDPETDT